MKSKPLLKCLDAPGNQSVTRHDKITALRQALAIVQPRTQSYRLISADGVLQKITPNNAQLIWNTGVSDIDAALPQEGLSRDGVHEFSGETYADTVTASGYLLALLKLLVDQSGSRSCHKILWCQTGKAQHDLGSIYGAGLNAFGLRPEQFIFATAAKNNDGLWALEEGARSENLLAVVADIETASFTQTRRLKLAAVAGQTPVLLLRPHNDAGASAAETRWRLRAKPSAKDPFVASAPGHPRWHVSLTRCRGGRVGNFVAEWNYETHCLSLVEQFSSRSIVPGNKPITLSKRQPQSLCA